MFRSGVDGTLNLGGGYYYTENSAAIAEVVHSLDADMTLAVAGIRSILALGNGRSLSLRATLSADVDRFSDSVDAEPGITYYFSDYTGVGVNAWYGFDSEESSYTLHFSHYFSDKFGVKVGVTDVDEGLDHIVAMASYRF